MPERGARLRCWRRPLSAGRSECQVWFAMGRCSLGVGDCLSVAAPTGGVFPRRAESMYTQLQHEAECAACTAHTSVPAEQRDKMQTRLASTKDTHQRRRDWSNTQQMLFDRSQKRQNGTTLRVEGVHALGKREA